MPHPLALVARNPLAEAKDTLSSWDKCMAKSYCKWPVIVAIIVGSLILFSVLYCIGRCLCCGAECACCCFRCCAGCCGGGKNKAPKYADPPPPMPGNGYTPSAQPGRTFNQQYAAPEPIQYARFESNNKPVNEDALPSMPTWGEATVSKVEVDEIPEKRPGDVELRPLDTTGAAVTTMGAATRSPGAGQMRSPHSQHQLSPAGQANPYGYDQFGQQQHQRLQHDGGYRGMSPVHAQQSPVYGAGAGAGYAPHNQHPQQQQYGRRSPGSPYDQYDQRHNPSHAYTSEARTYSPPAPSYHTHDMHNDSTGYSYGQANANAPYQNLDYGRPAPTASPSLGYAPSSSTRYEPSQAPPPSTSPAPAYPGQQTYQSLGGVGGQRPANGTWKDV